MDITAYNVNDTDHVSVELSASSRNLTQLYRKLLDSLNVEIAHVGRDLGGGPPLLCCHRVFVYS